MAVNVIRQIYCVIRKLMCVCICACQILTEIRVYRGVGRYLTYGCPVLKPKTKKSRECDCFIKVDDCSIRVIDCSIRVSRSFQ